ncbi:hypothetical protein Tco_0558656 [Tanacetum coccineum]
MFTPFIALQLRVARLEQEMSEIKKTGHSADVLALITSQVPTVVDKHLGTKLDDALLRTLVRPHCRLSGKFYELAMAQNKDAWIREVAFKVKDHKRSRIVMMMKTMLVDEGPSAGPNQGRPKGQPPPEQNGPLPCMISGNQVTKREKIAFSISKFKGRSFLDYGLKNLFHFVASDREASDADAQFSSVISVKDSKNTIQLHREIITPADLQAVQDLRKGFKILSSMILKIVSTQYSWKSLTICPRQTR